MSNIQVMYSSEHDCWGTPQKFSDELNEEFHFDLDACAVEENAKCEKYFSPEQNSLVQDWSGHTVFCNPPYGRKIKDWVKKAYLEGMRPNTVIVMLIPARTDTSYFHDYIYHRAEIRFIRGRLKFVLPDSGIKKDAPFPSMLAIFKSDDRK